MHDIGSNTKEADEGKPFNRLFKERPDSLRTVTSLKFLAIVEIKLHYRGEGGMIQGGGRRLPNYHLVSENCVLIGENLFDLPDLVGENICLLQIM